MNSAYTANQLAGRAIGSIFGAAFGALWLFLSLYAMQLLRAGTVAGVLAGLALLLLAALHLFRQAKRWPRVPNDPAVGRTFAWINAIQWIAVFCVAFTFAKLHIDAYVMCAITAIVGLHMFPLARLFRYPLHYAIGVLLVAWAAASALLVPAETLQGISSMGTGAILWLCTAVTLANGLLAARRPTRPLTC